MRVAFDPKIHGFQFSNNNILWSYGAISGKALCGGMIYVALDYWYAGMTIPKMSGTPQEGDEIHTKIFDRQVDAHKNTLFKFLDYSHNGELTPETESSDRANEGKHIAVLDNWLANKQPMPICLYGNFGHGHHTLSIGVNQTGTISFDVYDPNYPNKVATLKEEGNGYRHSISNELWKGFFIDWGYEWSKPLLRAGEFDWAKCYDCRLMYKMDKLAPCPKGGSHNKFGSPVYALNVNGGTGQGNWSKCQKCNGLYYSGNPSSAGICAEGGIHNPLPGSNYTLAIDGVGQGNWRRCIFCEGLFWLSGGGIGGICPGGERHKSDMTNIYTIPFAGQGE